MKRCSYPVPCGSPFCCMLDPSEQRWGYGKAFLIASAIAAAIVGGILLMDAIL